MLLLPQEQRCRGASKGVRVLAASRAKVPRLFFALVVCKTRVALGLPTPRYLLYILRPTDWLVWLGSI